MGYPIVKISRFLLAPLEVRHYQRLSFRYLQKGLLMGLVFVLVSAWIFSGWPQIWQKPSVPPRVEIVWAQTTINVLPNAKHANDTSGEAISEITGDDSTVNPDTLSKVTAGDNTYTVNGGGKIMQLDTFDVSSIPDGSTISAAVLHLQYGAEDGYTGTNPVRYDNGAGLTTTGITPTDITGWSADLTYDLYAQGVDTKTELQNVDIEFTNNDPPAADAIHFDYLWITVTYTAPPATTFLIGGTETLTKDTAVTTITFPEGAPEATISAPYNDVDTSSDPQVLSPTASEPVVKIKNTHASATYNIILEITTWTNSLVNMEYYNLAADGATDIQTVTAELSNANGAARTVSTGVSIAAGAYKDLYLRLVLASVAGKTGTSTLTVLGEAL